jgi:hypothetical protein
MGYLEMCESVCSRIAVMFYIKNQNEPIAVVFVPGSDILF